MALYKSFAMIMMSFYVLFNTCSMKQPYLYYFEAIKMTSQAFSNFCMENTSRRLVFFVKFDQACYVIFMASESRIDQSVS